MLEDGRAKKEYGVSDRVKIGMGRWSMLLMLIVDVERFDGGTHLEWLAWREPGNGRGGVKRNRDGEVERYVKSVNSGCTSSSLVVELQATATS